MAQSPSNDVRPVSLRVLTDDQIREIKLAAFDVLEKVGGKVLHKGAVEMLKKAGALIVDDRVKIPRHIVEECLRTAPKGFTIYDRQGKPAMEMKGQNNYYGTSTASPLTRDAFTGEIRETRVADIALGAKVADALKNIDWIMPMGSAQDVPALAADVHEFFAAVTNTTKPIAFIGYSPKGVELVYEMAAEVAGGLDSLRTHPFVLAYPEPISPLVFPEDVVSKMLITADLGMPQIPGPAVQPGATGPVTLAGSVVQLLAEGLMCLTIIQLRRPGVPCFLGGNLLVFDMRTANASQAGPEMSLGMAAQSQVAQSFGLPTWGLAGATDAKTLDAQAGIESTFSLLAQALSGLNLIHDVGYMDAGMECSAEMLVMGDEVVGMVKRFLQGMDVNAETLALSVIEKVGPGGNYLQEDHTVKHFRKEVWAPRLLTRQRYEVWRQSDNRDITQRMRNKIREIDESHKVAPLPDATVASLQRLRQQGEKLLTQD
jgi:trimethylamine--corrinoid protein Co-methyltransferase